MAGRKLPGGAACPGADRHRRFPDKAPFPGGAASYRADHGIFSEKQETAAAAVCLRHGGQGDGERAADPCHGETAHGAGRGSHPSIPGRYSGDAGHFRGKLGRNARLQISGRGIHV